MFSTILRSLIPNLTLVCDLGAPFCIYRQSSPISLSIILDIVENASKIIRKSSDFQVLNKYPAF